MTATTSVRIARDDVGTGEPALLCLPGWCGDRTVFDSLIERTAVHRRSLALDLRAHGESGNDGSDFTTADVVADTLAAIEEAGLRRVVPVTLAHAGWLAIELRRRLGAHRVPGIVLIDWMVLGPPPGFLDALTGLQDERTWQQVRAGLFGMWTQDIDLPAIHDYVASMGEYGFAHWRRAGREIAASFAAQTSPLAALAALDEPCPTLHMYAQPGGEAILTSRLAFAESAPWFTVRRLDAHSHFPTFEVPTEMTTAVEEFVCRL